MVRIQNSDKPVLRVKRRSLCIFRIDNNASRSDVYALIEGSPKSIEEQRLAQSLALKRGRHGEPAKKRRGNDRITRKPLGYQVRQFHQIDPEPRKRVIAGDG